MHRCAGPVAPDPAERHTGSRRTAQVEVGLTAIVDAVTDGTLDAIDPDRYESIPERRNVPRT